MAIPELKDLVKLPVAAEWKQLGVQLCVPTHMLDEIQANHENSPNFAQECLRDMFNWWLNNGRDVTPEKLECGLRDIGKTQLATQQHSHGEEMHAYKSTYESLCLNSTSVVVDLASYPDTSPAFVP